VANLFNILGRILRHRWLDSRDIHRSLDSASLRRIETQVTDSERSHSGEIRICIEAGLPLSYLWRNASSRERATTMFGKLRVWDTAHNNGVLIYLLLAERRIEIVADRGIHTHVAQQVWQSITHTLAQHIQSGNTAQGLESAVHAIHLLLVQHFPTTAHTANPNELPDSIHLQ
jgi:uncharacterized membrane protein